SLRHNKGQNGSKPLPDEDAATCRHRDGTACARLQSHACHEHHGTRSADLCDPDINRRKPFPVAWERYVLRTEWWANNIPTAQQRSMKHPPRRPALVFARPGPKADMPALNPIGCSWADIGRTVFRYVDGSKRAATTARGRRVPWRQCCDFNPNAALQ